MKHVFVMDEELLLRKHKVNALGKLIREDQEFGLGTMTYLAFGTIKALSRWDPEELLLNGVGETWTGIESKFSYNKKKGEVDQHDLIRNLAAVGIEPQLSWIIGDDCQTKENIEEDVDYLISLEPVTTQLTTLLAFPGTALYKRLKDSNRLVGDNSSSREYHLFGNNMSSLHFNHDERVATILQTYDRIYEKLGPSSMRSINVYLNGYEYCAKSKNPMLNTQKKAFFKKRIDSGAFLLKTAIEFAPAAEAKQVLQNTLDRYISIFGPMRKSAQVLSEKAYQLASREMERRKIDGPPTSIREVPLKRYEYAGQPIELIDGIPTANMAALPPDVPLSSLSSF
jgi:hypothetical protein